MTLANYLYALVYSDMYDKEKWQKWAENMLKDAQYDDNTEWIYDAYLAPTKQKFFDAISDRMIQEDYFRYNEYTLTEIIQGYYYYQYKNNKICLYEMLNKSGDVADAGQDSMGCEFFYGMLNELDKSSGIVDSHISKKISQYFEPLCESAIEQKEKLELATIESL